MRKQKLNLNDIKKCPEDKALYSLLVLHNLYWDCLEYSLNIHRGILITSNSNKNVPKTENQNA